MMNLDDIAYGQDFIAEAPVVIAVFVDEKIKNKLYNMIKLVQLIS